MKERRAKPRYNTFLPCSFSSLEEGAERVSGTIVNISEHGVAIEAQEVSSIGEDVEISFKDNWEKSIRFYGRVTHTDVNVPQEGMRRFGVQITLIAEGFDSLNELIAELADRER